MMSIRHKENDRRRQKTIVAKSPSDAAKVRRALLVERDRIKNGLMPPPEKEVETLTLVELWNVFKKDRQLEIDASSLNGSSLKRSENTFDVFFDFNREGVSQ